MPVQQGIEGRDSRFLRHDGTIPLSASWNAGTGCNIYAQNFRAFLGGLINLGNMAGTLRITYQADEIAELLGVSGNQAELNLKNMTVEDLAGVGVRAVVADVNGKLSAP